MPKESELQKWERKESENFSSKLFLFLDQKKLKQGIPSVASLSLVFVI